MSLSNLTINQKVFTILIFFILIIYYLLFNVYGIYQDVDNAWFASRDFNFFKNNIEYDLVFGENKTSLMYFGKIKAFIYGIFVDDFGWSQTSLKIASHYFVFSSAILWFFILKNLKYNKEIIWTFIILILLFEPFIFAANRVRPEAINIFLLTLSLFLAQKNYLYILIAGFISMIAFEIHPVGGIFSVFYTLSYLFYKYKFNYKPYIFNLVGGLLGLLLYITLHYNNLSNLPTVISENNNVGTHFIIDYFFDATYRRHLPELIIFMIALIFFIKNKLYKTYKFITILSISLILVNLIVNKSVYSYIIYIFPLLVLLFTTSISYYKQYILPIILIFALTLPQYSYLLYKQYNGKYQTQKYY
jgi:hypothetical protein